MPRKRRENTNKINPMPDAYIEGAGLMVEENITDTLEKNYMPYAMSVIVSRALPEIDGFKPSHRKLLYTMYKMGLLKGARTKSANIVGQTMHLNPHGDQAIYETMVRLTRGNETLLHPYVDSKGTFGKHYSSTTKFAASRYTEAKLAPICNELFGDIDKDTTDFVPNYDNSMMEPTLFPVTFPSILINANVGIAVSMASSICSFNLAEVCECCIELMKDENYDITKSIKGPDFPGGGFLIYDENELQKVYETGRGSLKLRSKWNYDKANNCIEVTEIPYSTTVELIINKVTELIKSNKIREISYLRDETGLSGLKITFDLKRGTDPEKLMQKLFKLTPLQDNYSCNFNILIGNTPKVLGVKDILNEWIKFREGCIRRRVAFDLKKQQDRLHILEGLQKILLDIDKAIKIIRETEEEKDVIPNLMSGFEIDEIQAEYIAEIKLRHLNKEYILKKLEEIDELKSGIEENTLTLDNQKRIRKIITSELKEVIKKYGQPRKTMIYYPTDDDNENNYEDEIPDYQVNYFLSSSGYFKKITPQSLRMSKEIKWKEDDTTVYHSEGNNRSSLLFFTDKAQVYKSYGSDFADTKASAIGDYIPVKLSFDKEENVFKMVMTNDYSEKIIFIYSNGKGSKVPVNSYETKTNRKKLANAYCAKADLKGLFAIKEDIDIFIRTDTNKILIFNTSMLSDIAKRDSVGVQIFNLKKNAEITDIHIASEEEKTLYSKAIAKKIPSSGYQLKDVPQEGQMTL
jgi:DNA gyrase subunit A